MTNNELADQVTAITTDRHPVLTAGQPVTILRAEGGGYVQRLDSLYGEEIWTRADAVTFDA